MIFIASICLVAFQMLIYAQRQVGGSYDTIGERLYGPWLQHIIKFFLCLSQMGFVASYLIFISQNIALAVDHLSKCTSSIDSKYYIWMVLAIIIPITWVRKIARLSWFAIIADVFILFGLICVLYFSAAQIAQQHGPGPNLQMINGQDFALMIGTGIIFFISSGCLLQMILMKGILLYIYSCILL